MYYQLVIVLALSVAGTLSLPSVLPTNVCAPEQWSGNLIGSISQVVDGNAMYLSARGYTATDYLKQKELIVQNITGSGVTTMYRQVTDFSQMKTYEIHAEERTCNVRSVPPSAALVQHCVGDADLNVVGTLTIGGKHAFTYLTDTPLGNSYITVWSDSFTPVSMVVLQIHTGIGQMIAYQVGNVSQPFLDPKVFDLPSYCMPPSTNKIVCEPQQFESMALAQLGQVVQGQTMTYSIRSKTSRDYTNKVEATVSNISTETGIIHSKTVTKWDDKKSYVINSDARTCAVVLTPASYMQHFCSDSKNLKWIASLAIDDKMADVYVFSPAAVKQTITIFRDTFQLITSTYEQIYLGERQMISYQYGNMTLGIGDRSVFDLPEYCRDTDATVW